ncbi:TM2 domain-containing protein [Paenibacillus sp. IB182496]|uniref:TM2 domain-containing protein n=1 Tax=Paenibacillus sabuli TaxID=2772509 RepID=A0A927GTZ5_9BACL|nr:TM2 domain-containing protein [Paenibacillus sabuli]MBD2847202.1 TM2 domain-containing protein [Paenibacillus sabuli]
MFPSYSLRLQLTEQEQASLRTAMAACAKQPAVAYVVWYFVGLFGGHRFYMGRPLTGAVQLALSLTVLGLAVTFVWWIIDAFRMPRWIRSRNVEIEQALARELLHARHIADALDQPPRQ